MDNDDRQIGRILNRREALLLLGGLGLGAAVLATRGRVPSEWVAPAFAQTMAQTLAPMCVVRPELTEGPYFVADQLNRSDIRSEPSDGSLSEGVPLVVTFNVMQASGAGGCSGLAGAQVDVWHCDALGVYSGVNDASFGGSTGQEFLRGYQLTDASGSASFTTIYPGWYSGRAVHVHFKIRTTAPSGDSYEFTSQFFFDDAVSDEVFSQAPYASKGQRDTRNSNDNIFRNGGDQLLMTPTRTADGFSLALPIALDLSDTAVGAPDGNKGMGGPGGRPPRP